MKNLCKYEFNCGSFLKHTIRAAEARCESILLKMFLKHVFKSCSGMKHVFKSCSGMLLLAAAGSSFRPAGAQIHNCFFHNFSNFLFFHGVRPRQLLCSRRPRWFSTSDFCLISILQVTMMAWPYFMNASNHCTTFLISDRVYQDDLKWKAILRCNTPTNALVKSSTNFSQSKRFDFA